MRAPDIRPPLSARLAAALRAQPPAPPLTDATEIATRYRALRLRMMLAMLVGYAAFYLVRKNFSMAMPSFTAELGYDKTQLGLVLTAFSVLYGAGKFLNGVLADRANPRWFIAIGLVGAALTNVGFGLSSALWAFGIFWLMNAWCQSMGWPACARLLTFWYSPRERGTMWGVWNASHQLGGATILVLSGYLIAAYGWRSAFLVPAVLAAALAVWLAFVLRDTPQSLGLPPVEVYRGEAAPAHEATQYGFRELLFGHVLNNKGIWLVSVANVFVYIVRVGVLDWAPTFLVEAKGADLAMAGWKVAAFEIAGIFGGIIAGAVSDRLFAGRRGPAAAAGMLLTLIAVVVLWRTPPGYPWVDLVTLMVIGFTVYGPQMLVGVAAADFASKAAAATATGLTGTFGYVGSALCGVGTGLLVDRWGWDAGFAFFAASAAIGTLLFVSMWGAKPVSIETASG